MVPAEAGLIATKAAVGDRPLIIIGDEYTRETR